MASRLLPDILTYIFLICTVDNPPVICSHGSTSVIHGRPRPSSAISARHLAPPVSTEPRYCCLGWITVTHVCRNWRQVALASPLLWATPAFHKGARWAEEMVTRSQSVPLHLDLYWAPDTFPLNRFLSEHISHIEKLRVSAGSVIDSTNGWMSLQAPVLKVLELFPVDAGPFVVMTSTPVFWLPPGPSLPQEPFGDRAPNLHTISIHGASSFFWHSSLLQNISHLTVGDSNDATSRRQGYELPTYDELFAALEGMQRLQVLHLTLCLPDEEPPVVPRAIDLPYLKVLSLNDALDRCGHVFRSLRLPNACVTLSSTMAEGGTSNDAKALLLSSLPTHISTAHAVYKSTDTLVIDQDAQTHWYNVRAGMHASPDDWDTDSKAYSVDEQMRDSDPPLQILSSTTDYDFLAGLCAGLHLNSVRNVSIDLPSSHWGLATWQSVAQGLPNVDNLLLKENFATCFLEECTPQEFGHWQGLRSVWVGTMEQSLASSGAEGRFVEALLGWLEAYQQASLTPPIIQLSNAAGFSSVDWIEEAQTYTQVVIHARDERDKIRAYRVTDDFGRPSYVLRNGR